MENSSAPRDPYAAFRHRDFRLLFIGRFITTFGGQMLSFAISWELWLRTHDPFSLGLVGLVDVATPMGLQRSDEDFGQTLGYWGVDSGPYLILPLLGPSTLRDAPALIPDAYANPVHSIGDVPTRNSLYGMGLIDSRAQYIKSEKLITGDKYNFIRSVYLQTREFKIKDGNVKDDF